MQIDIVTLFPDAFTSVLQFSLLKKAAAKGLLKIKVEDIRQCTKDKHRTADDSPYGGGVGMVLLADPILQTLKKLKRKNSHVVVFTPRGKQLTSARARQMASLPHLILVCGHYEEIDQRFYQMSGAEEISIGDYVLSGGEIPALVLIDAVSRFVPGVVGKTDSVIQDSFENGLLDYPHYTRPAKYKGEKVPAELMSGNHKAIECYRRKAALRQTLFRRPDLFAKAKLNQTDRKLLQEIILE